MLKAMKVALEKLSIPTYHGFNLQTNPPDCRVWIQALDGKFNNPLDTLSSSFSSFFTRIFAQPSRKTVAPFRRADWDRLLGHVSAVTDLPAMAFGPELIAAYPEAKVVLVHRDIDAWFRSYDRAVIYPRFHPIYSAPSYVDPVLGRPIRGVLDRIFVGYFGAKALRRDEVRRAVREGYEAHYELIRRVTPKERLLEYELGSGWGPLCEFLGVDEPVGVEFPRVNEMEALQELLVGLVMSSVLKTVKVYGWVVVVTLCAVVGAWLLI